MSKPSPTSILFPIVCCLLAISLPMASAQLYEPVTDFDLRELLTGRWYQQAYWLDNVDWGVIDCQMWEWTWACKPQNLIYFQLGYNLMEPNGPLEVGTNPIRLTEVEGKFMFINDWTNVIHYYYVIDYDRVNYDYIIWADTFNEGGYIAALSRKPNDPVAKARGAELAARYGIQTIHETVQGAVCNYEKTHQAFLRHRQ